MDKMVQSLQITDRIKLRHTFQKKITNQFWGNFTTKWRSYRGKKIKEFVHESVEEVFNGILETETEKSQYENNKQS